MRFYLPLNAILSWTLVNRQANHYFKNLSRTVRTDIQYSWKTGGEIETWKQASKHAKFYWLEKWMFVVGAQVPQVGFLLIWYFPKFTNFTLRVTFFTIQIALILISSRESDEFHYKHRRHSSSSPTVTEAELCRVASSPRFSHVHPLPPQGWCCPLWPRPCTSSCSWACALGGPGAGPSTPCCSAVSASCWPSSPRDTWSDSICTSSSSSRKLFPPTTTTPGKRHCWTIWWFCKIILEPLGGPYRALSIW